MVLHQLAHIVEPYETLKCGLFLLGYFHIVSGAQWNELIITFNS